MPRAIAKHTVGESGKLYQGLIKRLVALGCSLCPSCRDYVMPGHLCSRALELKQAA